MVKESPANQKKLKYGSKDLNKAFLQDLRMLPFLFTMVK